MDTGTAQDLMKYVDDLVTRKIQSALTPYIYGIVTVVTPGSDDVVTQITATIDGTTQSVEGIKCLEHVVPHVGDCVLLTPVNGLTGDWVALAVVKSAYVPGQMMVCTTKGMEDAFVEVVGTGYYALTAPWNLYISWTPVVDCWAILFLDVWMRSNQANVALTTRIQRVAPSSAPEYYGTQYAHVANEYMTVSGHKQLDYVLQAGTTYTYEVWVSWDVGGTGTIWHDIDCTKFSLLAWKAAQP
jgi:hypothetical protein